jgi:hypothetical protein
MGFFSRENETEIDVKSLEAEFRRAWKEVEQARAALDEAMAVPDQGNLLQRRRRARHINECQEEVERLEESCQPLRERYFKAQADVKAKVRESYMQELRANAEEFYEKYLLPALEAHEQLVLSPYREAQKQGIDLPPPMFPPFLNYFGASKVSVWIQNVRRELALKENKPAA